MLCMTFRYKEIQANIFLILYKLCTSLEEIPILKNEIIRTRYQNCKSMMNVHFRYQHGVLNLFHNISSSSVLVENNSD